MELWMQVSVSSRAAGGEKKKSIYFLSSQHGEETWNTIWNKTFSSKEWICWGCDLAAASSQIHSHRLFVGGLYNFLLNTSIEEDVEHGVCVCLLSNVHF